MGQTQSKNFIKVKDIKVNTCIKRTTDGGEGAYNYCMKVLKKTRKRNGQYSIWTMNPSLKQHLADGSMYTYDGEREFKQCACPKSRSGTRKVKLESNRPYKPSKKLREL
jgi:hypothetical protein